MVERHGHVQLERRCVGLDLDRPSCAGNYARHRRVVERKLECRSSERHIVRGASCTQPSNFVGDLGRYRSIIVVAVALSRLDQDA